TVIPIKIARKGVRMKKIFFLFLFTRIVYPQNLQNNNITEILAKFVENSKKILSVEYNVQKIDTFTTGDVWNKEGYALIERSKQDRLFGLHFLGERFDISQQSIYDGKNAFDINKKAKTYQITKPGKGFLGSPGGQMICSELFFPDSIYKSASLLEETKNAYIVEYQFKDMTEYNVNERRKVVELDKKNYFPLSVTTSYRMLDKKGVHKFIFSSVKLNSFVSSSVDKLKTQLAEYTMEKETVFNTSSNLLNKLAPKFRLQELLDESSYWELSADKLILLDFWEVWCGYCIKSLPELEKISRKFSGSIEIIGITTNDLESAKKLVKLKELTFKTLVGNENVLKDYSVNSFPRYILIDKKGIVKKEYYGFDSQIENDISTLLKE
ncbi:MAG: TlpA family protein disulfide reductase, partial [Candidatus Doudnabacteria bacterium]